MENEIRKTLDEAIERVIQHLSTLEIDSDEHDETIAKLEKLHKLRIEEVKMEVESRDKETQEKQQKSEMIDRLINVAVQIGLAVGGWCMYSIWQSREQHFELNNTPSTPMFRNLLSGMTPKMKR